MSKPARKPNSILRSQQVLNAFIEIVRPRLPVDLKNTRITLDDMLAVLGYASAHQVSLEAACQELKAAPSGNRLREVLFSVLPESSRLQRWLNTILRTQLPKRVMKGKVAYSIAIDFTLIPYHGECYEDEHEIMRGQAKAGTTQFHGYATLSIVHDRQRYVVALYSVQKGEALQDIVRWLLNRLKTLGIRLKCAYLDKAFCSVPVLKVLQRRRLRFIVPMPVRGKSGGVRNLFKGLASYKTTYTLTSPKHGTLTIQTVVVRKYSKGRFKKPGARWFAYAVAGLPRRLTPHQVFDQYRQRFGIEASYRQMNQVRARTTSRQPAFRLLLVGLAFVLFNLYIAVRQQLAIRLKDAMHASYKIWLTLRRLMHTLAQAVESLFGLDEVLLRQSEILFS